MCVCAPKTLSLFATVIAYTIFVLVPLFLFDLITFPMMGYLQICHQSLLACLDSPLNKAGLLQIYLRTSKNVLIEVHPSLRIPRTIKRFSGLMVQLLHKLRIRAVDGPNTLLRVIKNPIEAHLPPGCKKFVTSNKGRLVNPHKFVKVLPQDEPVVIAFGQMSHGTIEHDAPYADECLSFSQYPLSAACAIGRCINAFENHWGIL